MRSERNMKILAIVAIVIAVGGLSIGFATFSTMLSITNTTASVTPAEFEPVFTNLQPAVVTGTATASAPTFTPSTTIMENIAITLQNPGDSASYTFDIHNAGTMNAEITAMTMAGLSGAALGCNVAGDSAHVDAVSVCSDLEYTLTYNDGGANVAVNDTLTVGQTRTVTLTLTYDPADAAALPTNAVSVTGLDIILTYTHDRD